MRAGFVASLRQRRLQVGAYEAGAASYQDHGRAIYEAWGGRESRFTTSGEATTAGPAQRSAASVGDFNNERRIARRGWAMLRSK